MQKALKCSLLSLAVAGALASFAAENASGHSLYMTPVKVKQKGKFYALSESISESGGKVVELQIYDEIGFWGTSAKDFIDQLNEAAEGAEEILVAINSPGGDVIDAFAIYNALRRFDGNVTVRVDAIAASAASLIVMAGNTVVMPENAMLMIHNPWTVAVGTAEDMRKMADRMDKARDGIVAAYCGKSGQSEEAVIAMMDEETWMTALEAQSMGFADLIEEPVKLAATVRTGDLLSKFGKAPADLLNKMTFTPQANVAPIAKPKSALATTAATVGYAIKACKSNGLGHLTEGILLSSDFTTEASVDARVKECKEIAGLCMAAKLPDMADSIIALGLTVDQARARLFNAVTKQAPGNLNNRAHQNQEVVSQGGPNATSIYAKRKAASITSPSNRK